MIALVYDPTRVADPDALGALLGAAALVTGVPPTLADHITLPDAGYVVVRETWAGLDVLPGPVIRADVDALPDPGPDPQAAAAELQAAAGGVCGSSRRPRSTQPRSTRTSRSWPLRARSPTRRPRTSPPWRRSSATAPTAAQTAAATKALIRVLANYADVVPAQRATINVLADTIRFIAALPLLSGPPPPTRYPNPNKTAKPKPGTGDKTLCRLRVFVYTPQ